MTQENKYIPGNTENIPLTINTNKKDIQHIFDSEHIEAINTALACNRPLLITGEPGIGKTQLARAAAKVLQRVFIRYTVDNKTEPRDLLWSFDAIARLADAQIAKGNKINLDIKNYICPGPIWWGFDWKDAEEQKRSTPPKQLKLDLDLKAQSEEYYASTNGAIVLIDEIDKAEIDVPNGLLEALGEHSFQPDDLERVTVKNKERPPLVIITSNKEKNLPEAFIRRCVVLKMELPEDEEGLIQHLIDRGEAHSSLKDTPKYSKGDSILKQAAQYLYSDRQEAEEANYRYKPGQAEYLDLIHAIEELSKNKAEQKKNLAMTRNYIFKKGQAL